MLNVIKFYIVFCVAICANASEDLLLPNDIVSFILQCNKLGVYHDQLRSEPLDPEIYVDIQKLRHSLISVVGSEEAVNEIVTQVEGSLKSHTGSFRRGNGCTNIQVEIPPQEVSGLSEQLQAVVQQNNYQLLEQVNTLFAFKLNTFYREIHDLIANQTTEISNILSVIEEKQTTLLNYNPKLTEANVSRSKLHDISDKITIDDNQMRNSDGFQHDELSKFNTEVLNKPNPIKLESPPYSDEPIEETVLKQRTKAEINEPEPVPEPKVEPEPEPEVEPEPEPEVEPEPERKSEPEPELEINANVKQITKSESQNPSKLKPKLVPLPLENSVKNQPEDTPAEDSSDLTKEGEEVVVPPSEKELRPIQRRRFKPRTETEESEHNEEQIEKEGDSSNSESAPAKSPSALRRQRMQEMRKRRLEQLRNRFKTG